MRLVVAFGTVEGQARKVAEAAATAAREAGHEVDLIDVSVEPPPRLSDDVRAVVLTAPVHFGKHDAVVGRFVQERLVGSSRPTAFVSVSLAAADASGRERAQSYLQTFLADTGWAPDLAATVAGALRYSRYGFFKRLMMRFIARRVGLPTDTARDFEFTDWEEVSRLTTAFLAIAEAVPAGGSDEE